MDGHDEVESPRVLGSMLLKKRLSEIGSLSGNQKTLAAQLSSAGLPENAARLLAARLALLYQQCDATDLRTDRALERMAVRLKLQDEAIITKIPAPAGAAARLVAVRMDALETQIREMNELVAVLKAQLTEAL